MLFHSQNPLQELTYETPAAENSGNFMSSVSLKVANETLACSMITYYPDPEFTTFETTRTGDDVLITIQVMHILSIHIDKYKT